MALDSRTDRKLADINRGAEERDAENRAKRLHLPYLDLRKSPLEVDALVIVPQESASKAKIAVLTQKSHDLTIAAYDPEIEEAQKIFQELKDKNFTTSLFIVSNSGLNHVWRFYQFAHKVGGEITRRVVIDPARFKILKEKFGTISKIKEEVESEARSVDLETGDFLEALLAFALILGTSDIHVEAERLAVRLRFRVDGVLHDVSQNVRREDYEFLISRVKLLSELKLNVHKSSQDGRFTIVSDKNEIEVRVSVLPSEYGEAIVMRLLDPALISINIEDLGLRPDDMDLVRAQLKKPDGMILNTGPTGSGKTTTLYAFIAHINTPDIKVITIEDPIEYRLAGIEQTQVDEEAGYTFASGLRSIVRQDPDVILVGEIRDFETADIAMNAALTGHLVFSTLHTNDTIGAVPRLVDLKVKSTIIGPALDLVIAQRLVRRLCEYCKKPAKVNPELAGKIKKFLADLPSHVHKKDYEDFKVYDAVGCEKCGLFGYKGQIGVFEFLKVDDKLEELIYKEASEVAIRKVAENQGIVLMQEDGILKALRGITTLNEIIDNTGPIEWM